MPAPATNGGTNMPKLNYAVEYLRELAMAYPYTLYFGQLRTVENDNRFRWVDANTIKMLNIETTGRVDGDRDTIALAQRNYKNAWETKVLTHFRKWSTLVHPQDLSESRIESIGRITDAYNQYKKFPEMDAYLISKLFADWSTSVAAEGYDGRTADTTDITASNVISVFDEFKLKMDNARVPLQGRICYVTNGVLQLMENTDRWTRSINIQNNNGAISRGLNRLDGIEIVPVPSDLMQTVYNFTVGWEKVAEAQDIKMLMIHPSAIITPEIYETVRLDSPSALTENKYVYYEESYDDVFILNKRADAIQFNAHTPVFEEVSSPTGNPKAQGLVEKNADNEYVYTTDTTVDSSKTYYTRG